MIGSLSELTNLLTLDLSNNAISALTGLENCVNLKLLNLSYNKISNVGILQPLNKLEHLDLQGNKITDAKCFPTSGVTESLMVLYL